MKRSRMVCFVVMLSALISSISLLSACNSTSDKYPHPVDEDYGGGGTGGMGGFGGHGGH
ncbi:hypothetical protein [Legionella sp. 16cNR16C]|uniref:hypothetical protein n=1 Tax=Legionella sp. 16cNR16C TaxID=2905656 RepID=UPI001E43F491|nr:hypothetical protein [Legionella sp. 16cNR16C]MCE3044794.1 hypothetical protein [Legionella sp. 16cNR16C]